MGWALDGRSCPRSGVENSTKNDDFFLHAMTDDISRQNAISSDRLHGVAELQHLRDSSFSSTTLTVGRHYVMS